MFLLQHASLLKAINSVESPVKEKHVRNIILGTCYEKSALPFWYNVLKLPLYGNAVTCWKFCYTVHKLVRDGYPSVRNIYKQLQHSYSYRLNRVINFIMYNVRSTCRRWMNHPATWPLWTTCPSRGCTWNKTTALCSFTIAHSSRSKSSSTKKYLSNSSKILIHCWTAWW